VSNQGYEEAISSLTTDGNALNTSTTATSLLGASGSAASASRVTLPAGFFSWPGKMLKVTAMGRISNIVTTPGTLTLDVRLNAVVAFNGGAMSLNAVAKTNVSWLLEIYLTCRAIGNGTNATLMGQGRFTSESVVSSAAGLPNSLLLPASAPAVGTGFDSTVAQVLDLFGTWSISNAANSIQVHQFVAEAMN
jgi:hypothetical protein